MEDYINSLVKKHEADMYHGNTSITIRLRLAEERIESLMDDRIERKKDFKKIVFMFIAVLLAVAADITVHALTSGH